MDAGPLEPLHDFFVTLGGAAAALLGLLFVAVSINVRAIVEHEDTRELARQTFVGFITVLLYSLYALVPGPVQQLGMAFAATSAFVIAWAGPRFVRSFAREEGKLSRRAQILRFGLFLLLQGAAFAIGLGMLGGDAGAAGWLVGVELILLGSAARNSWEMLLEMGAAGE